MKSIFYFFALLVSSTFLFSCSSDDDSPSQAQNYFTVNNANYNTPIASLNIDKDGGTYSNSFYLFLADQDIAYDRAIDDIVFRTTMTHGILLAMDFGGQVNSIQEVFNNLVAGNEYNLGEDTFAITGINNWDYTATQNNILYGIPSYDPSTNFLMDDGSGKVKINSITFNSAQNTGTINCEYNIVDNNGVVITGKYVGNYSILISES